MQITDYFKNKEIKTFTESFHIKEYCEKTYK